MSTLRTNGSSLLITRTNNGYIAGTPTGVDCYIREYIELKNRFFKSLVNTALYDDTVIIDAKIPEGASGYFFGIKGNGISAEMSIQKVGSKIRWTIGNATCEVNWQDGWHYYGFVGGKFMYDGRAAETGGFVHSATVKGTYGIGGACPMSNASSAGTADCITDIYIRHAVIHQKRYDSSSAKDVFHYYPTTSTTTGTDARFYEARRMRNTSSILDGSGSATKATVVGTNTVTYGVSIDDLRAAFGCGYKDLTLLHLAALNPSGSYETITDTSSHTVACAFSVRDIAKPSNWSTSLISGTTKGELIQGQRPYWNLWADDINVGKNIQQASANGTPTYSYNVFRPKNGVGCPNLQQWLGYDNKNDASSTTKSHAPFISLTQSAMTVEWHNGVLWTCVDHDNNRLPLWGYGAPSYDYMTFYKSGMSTMHMNAAWGNCIDWHDNDGLPWYVAGTKKTTNATIVQCGLELNLTADGTARPIAQYLETDNSGFGLRTGSTLKKKLREGKDSNNDLVNWELTERQDMFGDMYHVFNNATGNTVQGQARLFIASNNIGNGGQINIVGPAASSLIVAPTANVTGSINPAQGTNDSGFRFILKTEEVDGYHIREGIINDDNTASKLAKLYQNANLGSGIGMYFTLSKDDGSIRAANSDANRVLCVLDTYVCTVTSGKKNLSRFTQIARPSAKAAEFWTTSAASGYANDEYKDCGFSVGPHRTNTSNCWTKARYKNGSTEVGSGYSTNLHRVAFPTEKIMGVATHTASSIPTTTTAMLSVYTNKVAIVPSTINGTPQMQTNTPCYFWVNNNSGKRLFFQPSMKPVCSPGSDYCEHAFQRYAGAGTTPVDGTSPDLSNYPLNITLYVQKYNAKSSWNSWTTENAASATFTNTSTSEVAVKYNGTTVAYAKLEYKDYAIGGVFPTGYPQSGKKFWVLSIRPATWNNLDTYMFYMTVNN